MKYKCLVTDNGVYEYDIYFVYICHVYTHLLCIICRVWLMSDNEIENYQDNFISLVYTWIP